MKTLKSIPLTLIGILIVTACTQTALSPSTPDNSETISQLSVTDETPPTVTNTPPPAPTTATTATTAPPTHTPATDPTPQPTDPPTNTPTTQPTQTPIPIPTATPPPLTNVGLQDLGRFLWENRLIVIFVDEGEDSTQTPTLQAQLDDENAAVLDRHILWFIVSDNTVTTNYTGQLSDAFATNLRARYARLNTTLEAVLIGKDGGVKAREPFFDSGAIYWQIDQMPMRQAEIQAQED